jgi:hypothetical protein
MNRRVHWLITLVCAASLAPAPSLAQDDATEAARAVDTLLAQARDGRVTIRPQAARRLVAQGRAAIDRLLERTASGSAETAELGQHVVAVLGEFEDATLRSRVWTCLADRAFPWRPAAAQTLAGTARADELDRFTELLEDPLAPVRAAAIEGLRNLDAHERRALLQALLADPSDQVRRQAAVALAGWGERATLLWLWEDLRRTDRFFLLPTGEKARYDSFRELQQVLGEDFGYQPAREPDDPQNGAALESMRAAIVAPVDAGNVPALPAIAAAGEEIGGNVLGLEIRSCREGEFFLRWNRDDTLLVGLGRPARVDLPEGSVDRLRTLADGSFAALEGKRFAGTPGCDLEQVHFLPGDERSYLTFQLGKGPEAGAGRPELLAPLVSALVATLPTEGDDPRLDALRRRVTEALAAVGGPLSDG